MARGENNVRSLIDRGIHIWDANAYDYYLKRHELKDVIKKNTPEWNQGFSEFVEKVANDDEFAKIEGDMGDVYGVQWRRWKRSDWKEIDQLKGVIETLRKEPGSRYAIINAWKVGEINSMALPPCHLYAQFSVFEDKFLDVHMLQRSCDTFLGVPFNTAQYPILGSLIARELGLELREFYHTLVNVHLYAGVGARAEFLKNDKNLETFRTMVSGVSKREDYLDIRDWYLKSAPAEEPHNERKDHIPFVLEQLSYEPQPLPKLEIITDKPFFEAIEQPANEVFKLNGYNPLKWDSKAVMAV
jgi:thymidylate synthase